MSTDLVKTRRQKYRKLGYGLFLHYGLYSLVGRGEWFRRWHSPPVAEYEALKDQFTAEDFDAPAWARWAREQGFRYVCLGARHHDGFSLYDAGDLSDFDAPRSAAGRDLIAEYVEACRAEGLACLLYHTTLDWRHPDFTRERFPAYQQFLRDCLKRLATRYGKIDGFWFDGNWDQPDWDWEEDALYAMLRDLLPEAILVNNSSVNALGAAGHPELDVRTFEQGLPGRAADADAPVSEMCDTVASHWGIAQDDYSQKSPAELIRRLVACRLKGANYLLNVGPTASGAIPGYEREALSVIGRWIAKQGVGFLDAEPHAAQCRGEDGVLQAQDGSLLCAVHDLPIRNNAHLAGPLTWGGWRTIEGVTPEIERIHWVDMPGESLAFQQDREKGVVSFEASANPYGNQAVVRMARLEVKAS